MTEYNIPNKQNYFVATGVTAWIQKKLAGGEFGDYHCVGNVVASNITPELERLEHTTNLQGLDARDSNPVIKKGGFFTLQIDELVKDNLELLIGSAPRELNSAFVLPRWEKKTFAANTITVNDGDEIVSVISVKSDSNENEYEEGESADYTVNLSTGVITRSGASSIGATEKVIVSYEVAKTGTKYTFLENVDIIANVKIVSNGGQLGNKRMLEFPEVELSIEGDINLLPKSEWQTATLRFDLIEQGGQPFGSWYSY